MSTTRIQLWDLTGKEKAYLEKIKNKKSLDTTESSLFWKAVSSKIAASISQNVDGEEERKSLLMSPAMNAILDEQSFYEKFKNAHDADADHVDCFIHDAGPDVVVTLVDDGIGLSRYFTYLEEQHKNIFLLSLDKPDPLNLEEVKKHQELKQFMADETAFSGPWSDLIEEYKKFKLRNKDGALPYLRTIDVTFDPEKEESKNNVFHNENKQKSQKYDQRATTLTAKGRQLMGGKNQGLKEDAVFLLAAKGKFYMMDVNDLKKSKAYQQLTGITDLSHLPDHGAVLIFISKKYSKEFYKDFIEKNHKAIAARDRAIVAYISRLNPSKVTSLLVPSKVKTQIELTEEDKVEDLSEKHAEILDKNVDESDQTITQVTHARQVENINPSGLTLDIDASIKSIDSSIGRSKRTNSELPVEQREETKVEARAETPNPTTSSLESVLSQQAIKEEKKQDNHTITILQQRIDAIRKRLEIKANVKSIFTLDKEQRPYLNSQRKKNEMHFLMFIVKKMNEEKQTFDQALQAAKHKYSTIYHSCGEQTKKIIAMLEKSSTASHASPKR